MSERTNSLTVRQSENTKFGMWVFLGGEVVFFITLILILLLTRIVNSNYEVEFRSLLSIPIIALNTFILLTSSYLSCGHWRRLALAVRKACATI